MVNLRDYPILKSEVLEEQQQLTQIRFMINQFAALAEGLPGLLLNPELEHVFLLESSKALIVLC